MIPMECGDSLLNDGFVERGCLVMNGGWDYKPHETGGCPTFPESRTSVRTSRTPVPGYFSVSKPKV